MIGESCELRSGMWNETVVLLELKTSEKLDSGLAVSCGRVRSPKQLPAQIQVGSQLELKLPDGRSGVIHVVGHDTISVTFYGVFK